MKPHRVAACVMLATLAWLALAVTAVVPAEAQFYDGNKLVDLMREWEKCERQVKGRDYVQGGIFTGFVVGVFDSHTEDFCPNSPLGDKIAVSQACAIVAKYLNDHPEQWSKPAHELVVRALKQAFPCGKAK